MSESGWSLLPNSPIASSRTDDIWFFDALTGWLVNSNGSVSKTEDGGVNWVQKFFLPSGGPGKPYLRCLGWGSPKVGWFGSITTGDDSDPNEYLNTLLHHTVDGGETWQAVKNLPENSPSGICGFYAVNEQIAYGSGTNDPANRGPGIIKTTDGGSSWQLIDMKEYADNLIDIYFMDENNGFVVGGKNDDICPTDNPSYPPPRLSAYVQLKPVVLRTTDGGLTWTNKAANTENLACGEWGWKIQFLNDQIGFVSLENFRDAAILCTTDGGETWVRKHVAKSQDPKEKPINNDLEGIGFLNENEGWVGGWGNGGTGLLNSFTTDGGDTWIAQNHDANDPESDPRVKINRYRISGDPATANGFAYCSGQQVYAYTGSSRDPKVSFSVPRDRKEPAYGGSAGAGQAAANAGAATSQKKEFVKEDAIAQASHNFDLSYRPLEDGKVEISYKLPANSTKVFLGLWNKFAFYVRTLVNDQVSNAGGHTVIWDGKDQNGEPVGKGIFICRMSINDNQGASHMIKLTV